MNIELKPLINYRFDKIILNMRKKMKFIESYLKIIIIKLINIQIH